MSDRRTAPSIRAMKAAGEKIACITAYDSTSASIAEAAGADLILVGDSVANVMLGYPTTLFVDIEDMIRHTKAAASVPTKALLVADLPFGSYQSSVSQAVDSSVALMKAGAEAVKLEGVFLEEIEAIQKAGIPVMGHVGLTPQSVNAFGGHKVQGKANRDEVLQAAKDLSDVGVFAIVLELVTADLAAEITRSIECPTIGIGSGVQCDGQVQVFHDVMGLSSHQYRHAKKYCDGLSVFEEAMSRYVAEVRSGAFPTSENSF